MANLVRLFFIAVLVLGLTRYGYTTEFYAEKTGKDCIYCHKNADGGSELTAEGVKYLKEIRGISPVKRVIRFFFYYLHILFGIAWFGTILYVHLILKPGYASKGLPRGELILGWVSIIIMAVSGSVLTLFKIDKLTDLFSSSWGIILSVKIIFFVLMFLSALFVTLFLGPKMRKRKERSSKGRLDYYDGKEGRPAYIKYDGKIYDLTSSQLWRDGVHMGRHFAGSDLTEALKLAPHKEEVLNRFNTVNIAIEEEGSDDRSIKVFYFLAYTNLVNVFIIIFLITLWKW